MLCTSNISEEILYKRNCVTGTKPTFAIDVTRSSKGTVIKESRSSYIISGCYEISPSGHKLNLRTRSSLNRLQSYINCLQLGM